MAKPGTSTGRFGARYGRRPRLRVSAIEKLSKASYDCPSCSANKVKRVSSGVWACRRCGVKFAGGAYVPTISEEAKKKIVSVEEFEEELPEVVEEISKEPEVQEEEA